MSDLPTASRTIAAGGGRLRRSPMEPAIGHRRIVTGAGPGAVRPARAVPAARGVVRCEDGISRNEAEDACRERPQAGAGAPPGAALARAA